ncbi:MAG: ABC transporter permease [Ruminiclostridium sp.]|nr:ABC transporter permease [Ruminiclostridium sp.]
MKVKGWKQVFAFTFNQQIKTKSFIIGTAVMAFIVALIAFLADFLPVVFMGDQLDAAISGDVHSTVQTLYVCDETEYGFDFSALSEVGITCNKVTTAEADSKIAELANSNENAMVSRIRMEEKTLFVTSCYPGGEETVVKKGDCESINSALANIVSVQYLMHYGVPESEVPTAMAGVHTELSAAGEEPVSMVQQILNAVVPMISSIILFIFIFSYSQLVAQAVAIEKSSRIIEYLLTSIKPLAIIIGKVLAMCCVSLLQFFIIGFGGTLGFLISLPFGIFTKVQDIAAAAGSAAAASGSDAVNIVNDIGAAFSGVDASVILIMIVTFILGFLLYAGLAGLAGASISKMEDLSSAIQPLSLIGVLGFYLAYFPQVAGEENAMSQLARYLPISSPFVLSSDYLLGKISIVECLISVAILAAADVLVMMFVAKVYETIILHTGNKLSVGDMLKMSK